MPYLQYVAWAGRQGLAASGYMSDGQNLWLDFGPAHSFHSEPTRGQTQATDLSNPHIHVSLSPFLWDAAGTPQSS